MTQELAKMIKDKNTAGTPNVAVVDVRDDDFAVRLQCSVYYYKPMMVIVGWKHSRCYQLAEFNV